MKPVYRVPTLAEIRETASCGLNVVSTFSGAGGSCLGFKMCGYRVLWASEFVDAAAETYALNHPEVPLDRRDVRDVTGADVRRAITEHAGALADPRLQIDVLEGSPPCASFSTAGKRSEKWGRSTQYSDVEQRVDDLFFEFARLVGELQPRVFVAENVSGLVKGTSKGYFKEIHAALAGAGYDVKARMLDAQWLGVPQQRQRVIFVGTRRDLELAPPFPEPLPYRYTIRDALGLEFDPFVAGRGRRTIRSDAPAPTVQTHGNLDTFSELAIPTVAGYAIGDEWDRLRPGESSDRYMNLVRPDPDRPSPTVTQMGGRAGAAAVTHPVEKRKFSIPELRRICGFPDDFELTGTYAQQYERLGRAVPPAMMAAVARAIADVIAGAARV